MKNTTALFTAAWLAAAPLFSQNKGVSPLAAPTVSTGQTRAVVIGISDYQEAQIPDLRFADKDALAFANFLRSPAGGNLDNDHLKVLTNENATAGRVAEALDALVEQTKAGDQVIIYFSGHGDVERKTVSQPGFLLCWDSPSRVYMGGGTYSLAFLQEIVTTLSTQNKAKVVVVTDACHAGKLAGSQIGGAQLTAANLAKQFSNEVKILSCQPGELSLEGEQWGGGRGIFSYHLVDGLFGLADRNGDGQVTLGELDRYLEDKVTAEAAPQSQVPMLLGNKTERLATVNAAILAELKKAKTGGLPMFAATEGRGFEDEVLGKADSNIRRLYLSFKKAVAEKRFFPKGKAGGDPSCADELYAQLAENESLAPLRGMMKRNYAAALQDDAQQTLNIWLRTKLDEKIAAGSNRSLEEFMQAARLYPRCLDRAAELLGEKHYMYAALKARRCFFEGYVLTSSDRNLNRELGERALALFRQSLAWQPEQPHVYWQISEAYGLNLRQPDSLAHYAWLAIEANPGWAKTSANTAAWFCLIYGDQARARPFLEHATRADSTLADVWNAWAMYHIAEKNFTEAEKDYKKAIALDSTYVGYWNNLGNMYAVVGRYAEAETTLRRGILVDSTVASLWGNIGYAYNAQSRYFEAEPYLKKAIALDSTNSYAWSNLCVSYNMTRRFAEALPVLKKTIALDTTDASSWNNLGYLYNQTRQFDKAVPVFEKSLGLDSTNNIAWTNLGYAHLQTRRYADAEPVLKKALALDPSFANAHKHLGMVCFKTNRPDEARRHFLKAIELNPNYANGRLAMAYLLFSEGKTGDALDFVEQAIGKGSGFEQLQTDEDLAPLRALPEWKALMKKHFADMVKD